MTDDRYLHPVEHYVEYDDHGGILRIGSMAIGVVEDMVTQGGNWLLGVSDATWEMRVNTETKELEPKTECEAVVDGTTIRNLPVPCTVYVAFQRFTVEDGELEIEFEQPGEYPVLIRSRTHLDCRLTVAV